MKIKKNISSLVQRIEVLENAFTLARQARTALTLAPLSVAEIEVRNSMARLRTVVHGHTVVFSKLPPLLEARIASSIKIADLNVMN